MNVGTVGILAIVCFELQKISSNINTLMGIQGCVRNSELRSPGNKISTENKMRTADTVQQSAVANSH